MLLTSLIWNHRQLNHRIKIIIWKNYLAVAVKWCCRNYLLSFNCTLFFLALIWLDQTLLCLLHLWLLAHHVILLLLSVLVFLLWCYCLLRNRGRIQISRLYDTTYNNHRRVLELLSLNYFATFFYRGNWGLLLLWLVHHLHISQLGWMLRRVLVMSSFHNVLLLLLGWLSYTKVIL